MLQTILNQRTMDTLSAVADPTFLGGAGDMPAAFTVETLREARGLSQIELASLAGMLPDHLRAIEAGVEATTPERQALAAALNVPMDIIL